jgi:TctA family transporter
VLVHPAAPLVGQERLTKHFPLIVGNPLETAVAVSTLIFGGVLERLPDLRMRFAHGGGVFPFTLGRLDHGWSVRPEGPASLAMSDGAYAIFVTRPIAATLLGAGLVLLLLNVRSFLQRSVDWRARLALVAKGDGT